VDRALPHIRRARPRAVGGDAAFEFLTGYLIEEALSVDNLVVFYTIFAAFSVPPEHQHRLLCWGIIGALVLRGAMILGGSALLARFHWIPYGFGALLIVAGVRMLARPHAPPHADHGRLFRALLWVAPTTQADHHGRLFVRDRGLRATPLLIVLVVIELTDLMFAVDSIVAIFAVTDDPFIVFTSNVCAMLGMRSLYFVLSGMTRRFASLRPALAFVLVFVGAKLAVSPIVKLPLAVSLIVVSVMLGGAIAGSVVRERGARRG
jgi:tellurite resistance protein TerC